jgi:hypothetical protein
MCFTILLCGYVPRCALDFSDSGRSRFENILDLIVECGLSVHDISRVELDAASKLPRFNMPLELGPIWACGSRDRLGSATGAF